MFKIGPLCQGQASCSLTNLWAMTSESKISYTHTNPGSKDSIIVRLVFFVRISNLWGNMKQHIERL
jgi:hypothetical protein